MLNIPLATLAFIVLKAREFDVKVDPVDEEEGSNPTDDPRPLVIEDYGPEEDATELELADAISGLTDDERDELVALMWVGRGDFDKTEWADAIRQARAERDRPVAEYLMGTPLLGDYLEEGAAELGFPLEEYEAQHLR